MSAPEQPPTSDTSEGAAPGVPGLSRWSEVYGLVILHFVFWVFLLALFTRRFA